MYNQGYAPVSLNCPNCKSNNVQVQYIQKSASTRNQRQRGILYKNRTGVYDLLHLGTVGNFRQKGG